VPRPAPVTHTSCDDDDVDTTHGNELEPNTNDTLGDVPKFVPTNVNAVPPAVEPLDGLTDVIVGAPYENAAPLVAVAPDTDTVTDKPEP
jgi:hypothetical protein